MFNLHDPLIQSIALGTGILLYTTIYRYGEWDMFVPKLVAIYGILGLGLVVWNQISNVHRQSLFTLVVDDIKTVMILETLHFLGIAVSMAVYRVFFHRLGKFPGPFWARVSNFYITGLSAKSLHLHLEVQALHNQYGDLIRVGKWSNQTFCDRS